MEDEIDGRRILSTISNEILQDTTELKAKINSKSMSINTGSDKSGTTRPAEPTAPKKSAGGGGPELTKKVSTTRFAGWKR